MLLQYVAKDNIKKKIVVILVWCIVFYIIFTSDYFEYINDLSMNKYRDFFIEAFIILGFIGLLFKVKIARIFTIFLGYLVVFEFIISTLVQEFSDSFYINPITLFFNVFVVYLLNTKEIIEIFNIKKSYKEKYYFGLFFLILGLVIIVKQIFYT